MPSWAVYCARCEGLLATEDAVAFVPVGERAVHLALRDELFSEHADASSPGEEWTLRAAASGLWFTKQRQLHAKKRATTPFKLLCPCCRAQVGAQVVLSDWPRAEHLLNAKACDVFVTTDATPPTKERVVFKKHPQLMDVLVTRKLCVNIQAASGTDDSSDGDDNAGQQQQQQSVRSGRKTKQRPPAMVWPTVDSIRQYFIDHHAHSKVSRLRGYQMELVVGAALENTIVYLPTGCGKTLVAVKTIAILKAMNLGRKIAFLVPTVPLVSQQASYLRRESNFKVLELSGQSPAAQTRKLRDTDAIVATPQFFDNLLFKATVTLEQFCIIVFDEAHHAISKHPYCDVLQKIARMPEESRPRIVALTASPFGQKASGTSAEDNTTLRNLCMVFNASLNTPTINADAPELQSVFKKVEWVSVEPCAATQLLQEGIRGHVRSVNELLRSRDVALNADIFSNSNGDADEIDQREETYIICSKVRKVQDRASQEAGEAARGDGRTADTVSLLRHLRKMLMVLPQLALQGPKSLASTLHNYFGRVEHTEPRLYELIQASYEQDLRAELQLLVPSPAMTLLPEDEVADKVKRVAQVIEASNFTTHSRAIVFVRRRKTAIQLAEMMEKIPSLRVLNPTRFIGHNSFEGMNWEEEQKPTLERFRRGLIRLLVATSVLEEGLDVPECSLVIQFDGITGMTNLVQSRGRARQLEGRFVVMCAPKRREKLQSMINSELVMLRLSRITANKISSKADTKQLMSELAKTGALALPEDRETSSTKRTSVEGALAEWSAMNRKFCVALGSMTSGERLAACDRDAALRAIRECGVVEISAVDQFLNLVALDVLDEREDACDFVACYEKLCCSMSFETEYDEPSQRGTERHFWMRMLTLSCDASSTDVLGIVSTAGKDDPPEGVLRCNKIVHGQFVTGAAFLPLSIYDYKEVKTSVQRNDKLLVVKVGGEVRFDFDLCSVHSSAMSVETVSPTQWILFGTFRDPPKMWEEKTSTRICADFHMKTLSFAFHVEASTPMQMRLLRTELTKFGIEVRDTGVKELEYHAKPAQQPIDSQNALLVYAIQALTSACCFAIGHELPQAMLDVVHSFNDDEVAIQALLRFEPTATTSTALVVEFRDFVADQYPSLKRLAMLKQRVVLKSFVTPTRVLFQPPEVAPDNRVFRHFDPQHFLYVYFRDESRELLDFSPTIGQRLRQVMTRGIHIGSSHFQFLGCSLSQLRNSSCIFTTVDPQMVRAWIGELQAIPSPAKYLKRLGQAFSSTRATVEVHRQVLLKPEDDIVDDSKQYVFTDGCGEIAREAASKVSSILGLPVLPSAFQIRLGGAKGVLVVSDFDEQQHGRDLDGGVGGDQDGGCRGVRLRKSMVKFQSPHRTLEVVSVATAHSVAYLTRQSIKILSDLGIPDETFLSLQDDFIESLAKMVVSNALGLKEMRAALPPDQVWWMNLIYGRLAGDHFNLDLVHRRIIHAIYQYKLMNTVFRARIPVSKGRNLMGVADFTGTLQYGEVYVRYTERDPSGDDDLTSMVELSGVDVLVHRSPCHHPGDLRILRCRSDVPHALKILHDCIVFPTCGPRPHPDECTGGDLDGDVFTVIWDKQLLPPRDNVVEAMTLSEALNIPPEAVDAPAAVDSGRLIDFFLSTMEHNVLGVASNAHVAVCDTNSKHGSFLKEALILAEICAREVDCSKNPIHKEIVQKLAPRQYPDFLCNTTKPSYKSQNVLGKMYRRALAISTSTAPNFEKVERAELDESFLMGGYLKYMDDARIVYDQYKHAIRMLLKMSGAVSEAELATGMIIQLPSEHSANYFRFQERSRDVFYKTQHAFKKQFQDTYGSQPESERRQIAAAWYAAAYMDPGNDHCLSFAWILADLLIQNKTLSCNDMFLSQSRAKTPKSEARLSDEVAELTTCELQLCILSQIQERFATLLAGFHDRLQAITALRLALFPHFGTQDIGCVLFGSSSLLTFESESDLDVVLQPVNNVADLKSLAKFAVTTDNINNIKLIEHTHVPVLSLSLGGNWTVEISTSRNGPIKTALFRAYMVTYPFFWPVVFFLVKWGKAAGLIRRRSVAGSGNGRSMFTPIGFMWLLLAFCLEKKFVEPVECLTEEVVPVETEVEMSFWSTLLQRAQNTRGDVTAARVIMGFFSYFSDLTTPTSAFGFDDPLDPINNTRLTSEDTEIFREGCYVALHQLIISSGDLESLLVSHKDHQRRITLSRALSKHVYASPDFHAAKILRESGVHAGNVKLTFTRHPNALRPDLYVADVEGDGESVRRIEEKIERIEEELGTPQPRRSTERFHRSGCCLLLFEGALSQNEQIAFQEYRGLYHVAHTQLVLHQAHLLSFMNGKAWVEHAVDSFTTKFIRQMVKLSHFEKLNPGQATAKAIARFGHHYLIHLPWSFHEESITLATIDKLEQEFERGREARELYESVMVARQRDKTVSQQEQEEDKDDLLSQLLLNAKEGGTGGGGGGGGGGGSGGEDKGKDKKHSSKASAKPLDERQVNGLEKASAMTARERGVAHSFYPMIDPSVAPFLHDFAVKRKHMHEVARNESYQVSIIRDSYEFNVRLTPLLELVKVKTRACRWLSATLKMHQELLDDGSRMDATPDIRYYVSATEAVSSSDLLPQMLERACQKAKDGQGVLEFASQSPEQARSPAPKQIRVSSKLLAEGVTLTSIVNVRHIRSTTYRSPSDGLEFRVMDVVEYTLPTEGRFLRTTQKVEAEIVMPALTPEARVSAAFARQFMLAGAELVAFLREQQRFGMADDDDEL